MSHTQIQYAVQTSTFIFPRTKYSGFYLDFNKARQQISFIRETEPRGLRKIQLREPFILPAAIECGEWIWWSHMLLNQES